MIENWQEQQALQSAFDKAQNKIRSSERLLGYYIRAEIGKFAETVAGIDIGLFDTVRGVSKEHGEFDFFAIRIPRLMQDWLVLPDGQMFDARVLQADPNSIDLDTLEYPEDKHVIEDRDFILMELAEKFRFKTSA